MKKKLLTALLVGAMALNITACGGSSDAAAPADNDQQTTTTDTAADDAADTEEDAVDVEDAAEAAEKGKTVAMVCSGDAGVYGMASLLYEMSEAHPGCELEVIPGITAANSGAAALGAPLNHDYCVISLSDLMTPWEIIEKRLAAAAMGDFCMAIYNPSSHHRADYLKKACDILQKNGVEPERACGYVENIGRENTACEVCTLAELRERQVNMFTTVFIGNSRTKIIGGKLVTPRGYVLPDPAV